MDRVYEEAAGGAPHRPGSSARDIVLSTAIGVVVLVLAALVWHGAGGVSGAEPPGADAVPPAAGDEHRAGGTNGSSAAGGLGAQIPADEAVLLRNPLYSTGRLAPLPCPAPDLDVHVPESMTGFLNVLADCLDEAWTTQFAKAGLAFEPPGRVFWTEPGVSPCREYPSAAGGFYCRSDKSVYIGAADVVQKWQYSTDSVVYASLLAHEYGHHVQGEAGALEYYHERRGLETEVLRQNAWTRKSELQANCLAGVFLGAVSVTYPIGTSEREVILSDAAATADRADGPDTERTHGSAENSVLWIEHGLDQQSPGACNTWAAEDDVLQ